MLYGLAIFIFVVVCIMLMGIILLQSSKSGGMGAAMGGGAINTATECGSVEHPKEIVSPV